MAGRLADRVAASLAAAASGVARRLDLDPSGPSFDVVLAGRVLDPGHPLLHERVVALITSALPRARPRRLAIAPVVGAGLEAAAAAGWHLTEVRG